MWAGAFPTGSQGQHRQVRSFSQKLAGWLSCSPRLASGPMNGPADALVGPATADVVRKLLVNLLVSRLGFAAEQCRRLHDHASLAVAALRHIFFQPCFLAGMASIDGKTLNCYVV